MAIYHCHCQVISRGQGRSAVAAAAYRSGEKITNSYDGVTHDYRKKKESYIKKSCYAKMLQRNGRIEHSSGTI